MMYSGQQGGAMQGMGTGQSTGGQPMMGGMGAGGGQGVAGVAKNLSWKLLFFAAAVCVLSAGVMAILLIIFSFEWAPFTFFSELFLLIFGLIMVILDAPIPTNANVQAFRINIYKFFLFMTRFTGRGIWYCFLGTMVWMSLFDQENEGWFAQLLGVIAGLYPIVLGIVCMIYGFMLSRKLDDVRRQLQMKAVQCPPNGLSKEQFKTMIMNESKLNFSDDELDYAMNGLSFTAMNDRVVSFAEYTYWLQPGRMAIV